MIHRESRGPVTVLRFDHGKANAIDAELAHGFSEQLRDLESSPDALVLTGTGSIFSAGVDLLRILDGGRSYLDGFLPVFREALIGLFRFPRPVVAALNGHAIAGGCIVACACDHRIMGDVVGRIGVPELQVGVPFPAHALEILRFVIPPHRFQEVLYAGQTYVPADAVEVGLLDEVVPQTEVLERACDKAARLAAIPVRSFALTKALVRRRALESMRSVSVEHAMMEVWGSDAVRTSIRGYVERTLGKKK